MNKFIENKLKEFREKFWYQFPDTEERVAEIVKIAIEQFIKEALEQQKSELIRKHAMIVDKLMSGKLLKPEKEANMLLRTDVCNCQCHTHTYKINDSTCTHCQKPEGAIKDKTI